MNLAVILMIAYHITLLPKTQVSVSAYCTALAFILGASIILTFIFGFFISGFMISSDIIWFIFNGFEYNVEDLKEYVRVNLFKFVYIMCAITSFYYIAQKII